MSGTRLLLVRHGEAVVTVERVVGGMASCSGLSDLGRRQAAALRDRLAAGHEAPIDALWSSQLPRARETAKILAPALGDLQVVVDDDLEERRPGEADGVPFSEFEARFGPYESDHPHRPYAPGAESLAAFHHRVGAALFRVVDSHPGQSVLISCHGGVVDVAFRLFLGLGLAGSFDLWTLNTSVTEFVRLDGGHRAPGRWRLVRYNDHAHLAGLPDRTAG